MIAAEDNIILPYKAYLLLASIGRYGDKSALSHVDDQFDVGYLTRAGLVSTVGCHRYRITEKGTAHLKLVEIEFNARRARYGR